MIFLTNYNNQYQHIQSQTLIDIKATKGFWTPERDKKLVELVKAYGSNLSWAQLARAFPGIRGKYIRERYRNHLDPNLKTYAWTWEQDQILKKCYLKYGNKWEVISRYLPGRSANQVKNRTKRRQFKQLFPQPPSKKKKWDPSVYRTKTEKNSKKLTIAEETRVISLKQEENHRFLKQEIQLEKNIDIIEEPPLPQQLIKPDKEKRIKLTKSKKFELTTMHLQRTFQLIRDNLTKKEPSDFYLIFQTNSKREIFAKIKSMQWTITQLWPLVTNRSNRQYHDQEIAFFLYCLIKADNKLANKILHRLLKCGDEEYLMRKVESMIESIDQFIRQELQIIRQKDMLEKYNQPKNEMKGQSLQSTNTNDTSNPKEEALRTQKQQREINIVRQRPNTERKLKFEAESEEQAQQEQRNSAIYHEDEQNYNHEAARRFFEGQYDFDFAMVGQQHTIGKQIIPKPVEKSLKLEECTSTNVPRVKIQPEAHLKQGKANIEDLQCQNNILLQNISAVEALSQFSQQISTQQANRPNIQAQFNEQSEFSDYELIPEPVTFSRLEFIIPLIQDYEGIDEYKNQLNSHDFDVPFIEFEEISEKPSSFVDSNQFSTTQQRYSGSNQIVMRVKQENLEVNTKQVTKIETIEPQCLSSSFSQNLRARILSKLRQKQSQSENIMSIK